MDDRRISEADVDGGRAVDAVERPLERGHPELAGLLGPCLHVRLVDLHDVGSGGEQIDDLVMDGAGVGQRQFGGAFVVVVLGLLGHRERPRHRDLDRTAGVGAQELDVADLYRGFRSTGPTTRGTGLGSPLRSSAVPGLSISTPESAVANRFE